MGLCRVQNRTKQPNKKNPQTIKYRVPPAPADEGRWRSCPDDLAYCSGRLRLPGSPARPSGTEPAAPPAPAGARDDPWPGWAARRAPSTCCHPCWDIRTGSLRGLGQLGCPSAWMSKPAAGSWFSPPCRAMSFENNTRRSEIWRRGES